MTESSKWHGVACNVAPHTSCPTDCTRVSEVHWKPEDVRPVPVIRCCLRGDDVEMDEDQMQNEDCPEVTGEKRGLG